MNKPSRSDAEEMRISDARAMRALAHPARVAMLDYLFSHGPATATQCSSIVGESPSDCSFHLRTLEKWGFVESLPVQGRNRPWRAVARHIRWDSTATATPEDTFASTQLLREYVRRDERALESYLHNVDKFSREWQQAFTMASHTVSLTVSEQLELAERYRALVQEYAARANDPSREDSRRVYLVYRAIPTLEEAP